MISMLLRGMSLAACLASAAFFAASSTMAQDTASPAAQAVGGPMHRQNFNFSNMEIRSAFKALSASGRVDIVVAPNVSGQNVNLQLTDKTWQEAMLILCQMYSLKYLVEDNYLYVQNVADFNKSSVENATALQQAGSMAPLMRDIIKLKNAKAKDLEESVKGLLSPRGRINVVERNNALLIFDTRSNIHEIRAAVKDLDIETYQVNIQAQLIQVDADAMREIGVDWQFGVGSGAVSALRDNAGKLPTSKSDFSMLGTSNQSAQSSSSDAGSGGSGSSGSEGASIVGGVAGATTQLAFGLLNGNLAVAVANLVKNLKGEVLAKPQITTIDNAEARIFMGEQVPIRVLDANGRQAIQLQDAGTSLTVTPHVTADGRVLLDLNPEKNSFRVDASAGTILQKQSAKTTVVVSDGETVVIAGLTTKEETETETGVPLLKDIPLIGYLFKHTATVSRKRDLIIFVTPHIVAQANRGEDLAKYEPKELKDGEGVYGDYTPKPKEPEAPKGKSAPMDTARVRPDYP
ncbi:MAG TPA: secretin N-terminal domain-containing protein [Fibrobacteria bacterium]|nr:secretin N-terminal domain-containing protein [Fibrobacteria bacterium]